MYGAWSVEKRVWDTKTFESHLQWLMQKMQKMMTSWASVAGEMKGGKQLLEIFLGIESRRLGHFTFQSIN